MNTRSCLIVMAAMAFLFSSCSSSGVPSNGLIRGNRTFDLQPSEEKALVQSANAGDAEAAHRLFLYHSFSTHDSESAKVWLQKSAELGHPLAEYELGASLVRSGKSGDLENGVQWLRKASTVGVKEAAELLREIDRAKPGVSPPISNKP
jgi:TPR repeat protein